MSLNRGLDINKENKDGETVLFSAVENGDVATYVVDNGTDKNIVKYLIENGADINKENKEGKTPLFYVYKANNLSMIEFLIKNKAVINKEDVLSDVKIGIYRFEQNKLEMYNALNKLLDKNIDAMHSILTGHVKKINIRSKKYGYKIIFNREDGLASERYICKKKGNKYEFT